jgi:hypothetical protein
MLARKSRCGAAFAIPPLPSAGETSMESNLGPLLIECDAPPFEVVAASMAAGFWAPADVCWRRAERRRPAPRGWLPWLRSWLPISGGRSCRACAAGHPELKLCVFERQGELLSYSMGQCPRCLTMYWQHAQPVDADTLE